MLRTYKRRQRREFVALETLLYYGPDAYSRDRWGRPFAYDPETDERHYGLPPEVLAGDGGDVAMESVLARARALSNKFWPKERHENAPKGKAR